MTATDPRQRGRDDTQTVRELLTLLARAHRALDEQHVPPANRPPAYRALEHT